MAKNQVTCARCGTETTGRSKRVLCQPCRVANRRAITRRYRDRVKQRPDYARPFLREQHGMTELDYSRMVVAQDGRCAGCGRIPPIAGKDLHIDHDHRCCPRGGRSCERCRRGLLCAECNMALGLLHDHAETLERLAIYLRKWAG
jgi:hypothetical protein